MDDVSRECERVCEAKTTMSISIRPATKADLAAIEAMIAAAYTPYIARIGQTAWPDE